MGYSRKKPNRGGWGYTFLKPPWNFWISYFTPENSRQNKALPLETLQNCVQKFQDLKLRPLENPHDFFLIILGNSISFIISTWKIYLLFFQYPSKIHILNQHYGVECMVIWVYIFDSLICNFTTIPYVPLKYITIAARNLW